MIIDNNENIRNYDLQQLEKIIVDMNEQKYRAKQIYEWIHKHKIEKIDDISNISNNLKNKIKMNFDVCFPIIEKEFISKIDETKKYVIRLVDDNFIETVLMKYKYGYTICISSEVGCNMGCKFCASTKAGMVRNLQVYELLAQIYLIENYNNINVSNIVIMGSGEPLCNYDNIIKFLKIINDKNGHNISLRNITISTCGIVPKILDLAKENMPITLALSLHAPNDKLRNKIMPINQKYNIHEVMTAMVFYYKSTNRRITFEYSLIDNFNDTEEVANELINLFNTSFKNGHVDFNINLIPVNTIKESECARPHQKKIILFKNILEKNGLNVTIRRELGKDISGSCGQLRAGYIK